MESVFVILSFSILIGNSERRLKIHTHFPGSISIPAELSHDCPIYS